MDKRKVIFIGAWFLINGIISGLISWIAVEIYDTAYLTILPAALLKVNFISGLASLAGYTFGKKNSSRSYLMIYSVVIISSLAGGTTGLSISSLIIQWFFSDQMAAFERETFKFSLSILPVLTVIISVIASSIDILMVQKKKYKSQVDLLSKKKKSQSLVIKEKGSMIKIKPADIVYLSSASRKTIIHSITQDFELGILLKNIEARLSENNFLRIHKQYVINTGFIERFYHIKSGLYEILLNDDDETVLPVGRKYSTIVKNYMSDHV